MSASRKSFVQELDVLNVILNYVVEGDDSNQYRNAVKKRHYQNAVVRKDRKQDRKITEAEFLMFRDQVRKGRFGDIMFHLVTLQFYQALRVSEVSGLCWEGVSFGAKPEDSFINVTQHVAWLRERGAQPKLEHGFKNSDSLGGAKRLFLHPQSYRSLKALSTSHSSGLIFHMQGKPFTYRQLQYCFNEALIAVNLPFRSTHILRHGGSTHYMNIAPDYALNQMILGNTSLDSTKVYAQRSSSALQEFNAKLWATDVAAIGCKSEILALDENKEQKK